MGLPYMANPGFCKLLTPTGNYAPVCVLSGRVHLSGNVFSVRMQPGNRSEVGKAKMEPPLFYHQMERAATLAWLL